MVPVEFIGGELYGKVFAEALLLQVDIDLQVFNLFFERYGRNVAFLDHIPHQRG